MLILHPRVVADPIDSSIIVDAGIAVDGALIVGCGLYRQIRERFGPADEVNLPDCIVLPGLVNAHTHLELSHLKGKIPYDGDFVDWVFRLTKARGDSHDSLVKILIDACRESLQSGVTTVGDICYEHRAWRHLKQLPIRKTCFAEVFGMTVDCDTAEQYLQQCIGDTQTDGLLRLGLSPHAPYSARPGIYETAARLADKYDLALTTHLAETPGELEFLMEGGGPWLEYLRKIGRWDGSFKCPHQSPVEYFLGLDLAGVRVLLGHVNYISDEELSALARTKHSVVFCPRSHGFFGHERHPFERIIEMGVNVCLGTDSLASNETLSILDEMRFLHRQSPGVPVGTLLKMGTINGAIALGWQDKIGSVAPGKEADLIAIPLSGTQSDPLMDILRSAVKPELTMVQGCRVKL